MANDLLITAIRASGHDIDAIAEIAGVDPRTVQRWLAGRVPHPRYRQALARALGAEVAELWPDAVSVPRRADRDEIIGAWRRADQPDVVDWRALLRSATEHVDLLGYSLSRVLGARGASQTLTAKADAGCQIRIAIADPDSEIVRAADRTGRPSGRLTGRIKHSRQQLEGLAENPRIQCRQHHFATTHTILRFDDQLLLTLHLHGVPGTDAPLLHLRRNDDYGIFDQLLAHLETVWQNAAAITPANAPEAEPPPAPAPQTTARDRVLDELDYVWRPGT